MKIKKLVEVFPSEKDAKDHYDRHPELWDQYKTYADYEYRADVIARMPKGLPGTEDKVWTFIEKYLGEYRVANYIPDTGEFVSFNIINDASSSDLKNMSRFDIKLHTFHKEDLQQYKITIKKYFHDLQISQKKKCKKDPDGEKTKKCLDFIRGCGVNYFI